MSANRFPDVGQFCLRSSLFYTISSFQALSLNWEYDSTHPPRSLISTLTQASLPRVPHPPSACGTRPVVNNRRKEIEELRECGLRRFKVENDLDGEFGDIKAGGVTYCMKWSAWGWWRSGSWLSGGIVERMYRFWSRRVAPLHHSTTSGMHYY